MHQPNVSLPYRTPRERASMATRRLFENALISLAIVACVTLLAFLTVGDFSSAAWSGLVVVVGKDALTLAIAFLRHLHAARSDDGALSQ